MKLIDKLASDEAEKYAPDEYELERVPFIFGYRLGFKKAREMAAEIAKREGRVEREIFETNAPEFPKPLVVRSEAIAMQISCLGEEEVE